MKPTEAIQKLRAVIARQHKALATEESYVHWLRRYMVALRELPPSLPSEQKLQRFLSELAVKQNVAASTQNQAFNAIVFFYKNVLGRPLQEIDALRATRPAHLRHAPTRSETRELWLAVRDRGGYPTNLITRMLYGCGLRVTEPLNPFRINGTLPVPEPGGGLLLLLGLSVWACKERFSQRRDREAKDLWSGWRH